MNWEALRPGQRASLRVILERIIRRESYTANVLPTRYGKSDVMRVSSTLAWADGHVACSLGLSPNAVLRHQLADALRWRVAFERYDIVLPQVRTCEMESLPRYFPGGVPTFTPNDEMFVSTTLQLVERNIDLFALWVESVRSRTGLPVLVHIDECHMGGEALAWGDVSAQLVAAGALVVLHTATAMRSDGRRIPGFEFETLDQQDVVVAIPHEGSRPELVRVDIYDGQKRLLRLHAHHTTTFREAWEEQPASPLCKVTRLPFDVDLSKVRAEAETKAWLSEMLPGEVRKALGRVLRTKTVIDDGVGRAVKELLRFRALMPNAALIVFCCNDTDSEDKAVNKHAREIERAFERHAPGLVVRIATAADDDNKGKVVIEQFAAGLGDVLIVKQMASLGLDIDRLKVALDLSPVRTPAAFIQRMMRIATPVGPVRHCIYVGPADVVAQALHDDLVLDQGGAMSASDLTWRESYEVPRSEEPPVVYGVRGTDDAAFGDTDGREAERGDLQLVNSMLDTFPGLTSIYTHPQIAALAKAHGWEPPQRPAAAESVEDTGAVIEVLRGEITATLGDLIPQYMKANGVPGSDYGEVSRDIYLRVYQRAGIQPGQRLPDIRAISQLRAVLAAAKAVAAEVLAGPSRW